MYKLLYMRKVYLYIYNILILITGVQDSGVIIDRLLWQCSFVWSEIIGPHSSGNFNDSIIHNIFIYSFTWIFELGFAKKNQLTLLLGNLKQWKIIKRPIKNLYLTPVYLTPGSKSVVVPRSISTSHNFNDVKWFLHRSLKLVGCRQLPSKGHSRFLTVIASDKTWFTKRL